ncbi:hypothetical protein BH11ACT3_BH11ACT3_11900 [soil metagenome]
MADEQIPLTREFTVDEGYATKASWALTRRLVVQRATTWLGLIFAAVAVGLALLGVDIMWWLALLLVVAVLVPIPLVFSSVRRGYRKSFPPGTVLQTGFGTTRFTNAAPQFTTTLDYTIYDAARREGDFVWLRRRDTKRGWSVFPGALFGDDDLARFPTR